MTEENPYQSPNSTIEDYASATGLELAERVTRLGAAIIDGLISLVIIVPIMFMTGFFSMAYSGEQPGIGYSLMIGLLGMVIFLAIQFVPLKQSGQTWGKRFLKIKIVNMDGSQPEVMRLIGLRYVLPQLISSIPLVGGLFALVNILFIFRADRRCIHDLIAGTQVVKA